MSQPPFIAAMARKLSRRSPVGEADVAALTALPFRMQTFDRAAYIVREGKPADRTCLIVSGFAYRQKVAKSGGRQILSVHLPGDFVGLEGALLDVADHNVQALTRCEIAIVPRADLRAMLCEHPALALALWVETVIDASIFRERILNIGRRDARGRLAHLLCEFARRLEILGLAEQQSYELPMTQEELADATGLTPVHVNRVLRDFDRSGLIRRVNRVVTILDWDQLCAIADFNETYLHLDQSARARRPAWPPAAAAS